MSFIQDEIILPVSVVSLIAGFQLAIFFLFQYLKMKDEDIGLNKILLAYALFFAFAISGALSRVLNTYFFQEISINKILTQLSFVFYVLSIDSFLLIISTKSFHQISGPFIPRLIVILTIIPLIFVFIIDGFVESPYIMIIVLIGFIYLLFFQYKLINLSTGNIKNRLMMILI